MADGEDRTEAASARRLERARMDGSIPISREVPALAGLAAVAGVLAMAGPMLGHQLIERLGSMLAGDGPQDAGAALRAATIAGATMVVPVVAGLLIAAIAAAVVQHGLVLSPNRLMPDFARLSPARGLKRLFGLNSLVESAKSAVKLCVLGYAAYHVLSTGLTSLRGAVLWLPGQLADRILRLCLQLAMTVLGVQAIIAGADTAWVRFRHARDLRMSKEEVKQEAKETDGNPVIKRRLKQLRMLRARKRMLAAVPTATVVVTNPTHYAIALAYDRAKHGAPRVVAKGVDEVAARIREVARDNRVPLVANPPLARALYMVELDDEVPAEHFKVVAEIIAYVWRLRAPRAVVAS